MIWVFPKIGRKPPKWMVYNGSNTYEQMDDLGVFPYFWVDTHMHPRNSHCLNHKLFTEPGCNPEVAGIPSLKLIAKAPENGWLEMEIPI